MRKTTIAVLAVAIVCLTGCRNRSTQSGSSASKADSRISTLQELVTPKYAEGYSLKYQDGICLVDLQDPQKEESQTFHYALISRGSDKSQVPSDYTPVEVPISSVICMTSLQLSNFIALGKTDAVKGITSTRHLFNEEMNRRIEDGRTHKIGIEGNFDNEVIMGINPDLILISPFKRGGYDALMNVGITLVPHLGYKEMSPLGQAEWIKFIGLLLGQEEKANEIFEGIEKRYLALTELTSKVDKRPVVFSGEIQGGNWYAVGGNSFLARIFNDAGADYFLKDDNHSGGINLDFELVYSQAANADYWRIVNSFKGDFSYEELAKEDTRYTDFKAFKEHGVVYCNMSQRPFYESMPMEPDLILSDFIKAFHPELLPDYTPKYYEILK
ncbi:MAG: ABC transporter substrate-binding protein [Bacteroidaceae bacterium]|nr:ABC transporter substrate-binding protein [Bacteroidaceae bacterium]